MGANTNMNANGTTTMLDVELVRRSMQWDEDAFRKVYEATYYRMLYIAKKYMKNDTAAEDVLQEAYIKIWTNLPQLGKPEAYVSWASRIVANTALNELRKNQPTLFSQMAGEGEDGSEMAFDVEDTYVPNQPELSFTDAEEQTIIREMIDSLSDEQRMCVLMYYMEDLSVGEIAETLGCSEGTVKSRLNYGRRNIKAKVEDLQKKGYNFKGISAMAVLLLLLGREAARMWAKPVVVSAAAVTPAAAAAAGTQAVAGVGTPAAGTQAVAGVGTPAAGASKANVGGPGAAGVEPAGMAAGAPKANVGGPGAAGVEPAGMAAGAPKANVGGPGAAGVEPAGTAAGASEANVGGPGAVGTAPAGKITEITKINAGAAAPEMAAEAGAAAASKAGFLSTLAGKIIMAVAGLLVVGGIILAVFLMNKDKDEQLEREASNTTEISTVGTESISTETDTGAVTTEADTEIVTTEADTEPKTEEVTEEPAEYYAYVDAYLKVLQEHRDTIKLYEGIDYLKHNEKSVAFADVNLDEIPELFLVEADDRNRPAYVTMYTMIDGKAVLVECPENTWNTKTIGTFSAVAGGGVKDDLFFAKKGLGFYWEGTEGDETRTTTIRIYTLTGNTLTGEVIDESYSGLEGKGHPIVISEDAKENMGDVIISNTELLAESGAMSYHEAEAYLKQMQIANYHEPGWQKIDDHWYYYNKAGRLQTGWLEDDGKWYFLSATGEMYTGWKTIKGNTYYFNEKGAMSIGEVTIDSQKYKFDENGILVE